MQPISILVVALLLLGEGFQVAASAKQKKASLPSKEQKHMLRVHGSQSVRGIKHIAIIGERHSGTNFMRQLLLANLRKEKLNITDHFCAYKHAYQAQSSSCLPLASTLVVVMFRNPYDWAFAMHRRCWCAFSVGSQQAALSMASLDFETFLTQPWRDDSLKPWTQEKDISTCDNVMQCRAYKYLNFLNISNWAPNVEFVRHEDVLAPHLAKEWLRNLVWDYGLPLDNTKIRAVKKYKQSKSQRFDPKQARKQSVWFNRMLVSSNSTLKSQVQLISNTMNPLVESMVGYSRYSSKNLEQLRLQMENGAKQSEARPVKAPAPKGIVDATRRARIGATRNSRAGGGVSGSAAGKPMAQHSSGQSEQELQGADAEALNASAALGGWWSRLWGRLVAASAVAG